MSLDRRDVVDLRSLLTPIAIGEKVSRLVGLKPISEEIDDPKAINGYLTDPGLVLNIVTDEIIKAVSSVIYGAPGA